jgi:hypothetical protein
MRGLTVYHPRMDTLNWLLDSDPAIAWQAMGDLTDASPTGKQQPDGRWLLDRAHYEALAVPFSESIGEPSRWNTLRASRVMRWYEAGLS